MPGYQSLTPTVANTAKALTVQVLKYSSANTSLTHYLN